MDLMFWLRDRHQLTTEQAETIAHLFIAAHTPRENARSTRKIDFRFIKRFLINQGLGCDKAVAIAADLRNPVVKKLTSVERSA